MSIIHTVMQLTQCAVSFIPQQYQKPVIGIVFISVSGALFMSEQTSLMKTKVVDLMSSGLSALGFKDSTAKAEELLTVIDQLDGQTTSETPSVIGDVTPDIVSS